MRIYRKIFGKKLLLNMAAQMLNFDGLYEHLIDQIATDFEWDESEESGDDFFVKFDNYQESTTNIEEKLEEHSNDECDEVDYYMGRDGATKWNKNPPQEMIKSSNDDFMDSMGPQAEAKSVNTMEGCLFLFLSDDILQLITDYTNVYITKIRKQFSRNRDCNYTNVNEVKIFIGLLILIGLFKSKNKKFDELWEQKGLGVHVFRLSMNIQRFKFLLRCLHFDDIDNRECKKKVDNLIMIREIFEIFVKNCQKYYTSGKHVTISEHLIEVGNHYPYSIHSDEKSASYGIKIYALIDNHTYYILSMGIHMKKSHRSSNCIPESLSDIVKRLMVTVLGSGRNVILNEKLCNVSLINDLSTNQITAVGMINSNDKAIPSQFVCNTRKTESIRYAFNDDMILMSNVTGQNMPFISNLHDNSEKSNIASFYKKSISVIDNVNNKIKEYSVARQTRRYTMSLFFYLIDIACLNSFVIYYMNNTAKISRREFLKYIGLSLVSNNIEIRSSNKFLPKNLRDDCAHFLSLESLSLKKFDEVVNKPMRCAVCPRKRDIKVRSFCSECKLPMCKNHMIYVCKKCSTVKSSTED